jgi:hypothetical protein
MNKIELYSVISSRGSYDDYHEYHEPIIYATKEAADKKVQEIYDANKVEPFPFDWCTEDEFQELMYSDDDDDSKKASDEDIQIYDKWDMDNYHAREFNKAWVSPVEVDMQSWRERQLKGII